MSANHFPVMRAMALQAAAVLARYERHVRKLAATWLDMELYTTVSEEVDEIRRACAPMPELAVPWTKLLISHAELVHVLWRSGQDGSAIDQEDVDVRLQEHLASIDFIARRCVRLAEVARSDEPRF